MIRTSSFSYEAEKPINPTVIEEENPQHSQDELSDEAGVNLDFDTPSFSSVTVNEEEQVIQAAESAVDEAKAAAAKEAAKGEKEVAAEEKVAAEEAKTAAVVQAKVAEEEQQIAVAEEGRSRRKSIPSFKISQNKQQVSETEAAKKAEEAKVEADAKAKELEAAKAAQIVNLPLEKVSVGFSGTESTIAYKIVTKNTRLETYNPNSQANTIFGSELYKYTGRDSLCSLCGFKLSDRIDYRHNNRWGYDLNQLTWSYDHFVPINFSAVMFRIPVSKGIYEPDELEFLKVIGGIACYHCNYEKSQRMFVTCRKVGGKVDFNNFEPKTESIKTFLENLYKSQHKSGWGKNPGERTLNNCLISYKYTKKAWIDKRFEAIKTLAQNVCNLIKRSVDRSKVETRIKLTKVLVQKAKEDLKNDVKFKILSSQEAKNRYTQEYTAKLFGAAELTFPKPWKTNLPNIDEVMSEVKSPFGKPKPSPSGKPVTLPSGETVIPTTIINPSKRQQEQTRPDPRGERGRSTSRKRRGGSSRKRTRKSRRKTYRRIRLF
jgi:hypothetical protein